jgi:hypothetical protein
VTSFSPQPLPYTPTPELAEFLQSGPPPVYIGCRPRDISWRRDYQYESGAIPNLDCSTRISLSAKTRLMTILGVPIPRSGHSCTSFEDEEPGATFDRTCRKIFPRFAARRDLAAGQAQEGITTSYIERITSYAFLRCDEAQLVPREHRIDTIPVFHYGRIASSDPVMKSVPDRD